MRRDNDLLKQLAAARLRIAHRADGEGYGPGGTQPYQPYEGNHGGEAQHRWDSGNPKISTNGAAQGRQIPNVGNRKPWDRKPRKIPNATGLVGVNRGKRYT